MKQTFNILSLSGGGIKGIFQSTFLNFLEKEYNVPLSQIFDLVAGTSTGSIVGAALANDISMKIVSDLYHQHGQSIFKKKKIGVKALRTSWYSNDILKNHLYNVFKDRGLKDAKTKLLIPSTSLEDYKYNIFTNESNETIVDALMSSAAAPFYFDAYQTTGDINHYYMDGGLWANNPTLLAILYSVNVLDVPKERIRVLSIGTLCMPQGKDASSYNELWTCKIEKVKSVISAIFSSSETFAHEYSEELLKELNIIHIDPSNAVRSMVELDDVQSAIKELPLIAEKSFEAKKDQLVKLLGGEGRTSCTLKRKDFISESSLLKVGLADFVPTRKHFSETDKESKVYDFLRQATTTIRIMSVSLSEGLNYHGLYNDLEKLLCNKHDLKISISLLDFTKQELVKVMAPILNMEVEDLKTKVESSVKKLFGLTKKYKNRVTICLHDTIPFGTVLSIDEDLSTGALIVETRPYKLHSASSFSYKLLNTENSILFKNIVDGCKNIDNDSVIVTKRIIATWKNLSTSEK